MNKLDRTLYLRTNTKLIAGMVLPFTPLISRAIEYTRGISERYLFNHAMRTWLFASAIAREQGINHDGEVLAVSTILHDIGLTKPLSGALRFEVEGANAARELAHSFGVIGRRGQLIWDCVALHSTPSIGLHKELEVSLCAQGIALDWGGMGLGSLRSDQVSAILREFPRLGMKQRFTHTVCTLVERHPDTTYDNFASDFGEKFVPGYKRQSAVGMLLDAPFDE